MAGVGSVAGLFPLALGAGSTVVVVCAIAVLYVVYSAKLTWIATVCMDLARPTSAATDYPVPMSIEGTFVTAVHSAGLALAAAIGFPWLLTVALTMAVVGAVVAPTWARKTLASPGPVVGTPATQAPSPQGAPAEVPSSHGSP
ncbi:hypothetical protein [Herbihabitans rhizosphaerae]|uniref:hypothetical protein n=1 Tax=Herbihabitans rhizosphaerae TaxID=1872711 RepID=UPI0013EEA264|nr:hypothetical protein [Herbihabitans rhizosphaerae]